jgi:septation ring formation regulator EzrA
LSQSKPVGEAELKHQRHFEPGNRSGEALRTRTLIADIDRIVQILSSDIAAEEEQAGIFDPSRVEYPVLARTLTARRDNLGHTIAALQQRLVNLPAEFLEPGQ